MAASQPTTRQRSLRQDSRQPPEALQTPAAGGRPFKRFLVLERPETWITWASDFPDGVKFRKGMDIWPFHVALEAFYNKHVKRFTYACSCQDKLLQGFLRLDLPTKQLQYRKRLPIGNGASVAVSGRCNYEGLLGSRPLQPSLSVRYELGNGSASLGHNTIGLRQRLPITRNFGVEFCGHVKLPLSTAEFAVEDGHNTFAVGEGPLQLHVEQSNLIIQL